MRTLLSFLVLGSALVGATACNATPTPATAPVVAPTTMPPARLPEDAKPMTGPEEALPEARTVDATAGACGPFDAKKTKRVPVLGGRLEIAAVAQSANDPRPYDVMSSPLPDGEETRLIADVGGKKWVVLVEETWQTDPGSRPLEVKMTGRDPFTVGPRTKEITSFASAVWDREGTRGLKLDRIATDDASVVLLAAVPNAWVVEERPGGNATLALGAVAILPDTTLVKIGFYSNETDAKHLAGCRALAESLAASLKVGPRKLDLSARTVKLAPTPYAIDLPKDYVVTHQPGHDFDKFTVRKLRPLGLFPGQIQIVDDRYAEDAGGPQKVQGKLLGVPTEWSGEFGDRGGTLFASSPKRKNGARLVVGINATRDVAYLDEFRRVAETIR